MWTSVRTGLATILEPQFRVVIRNWFMDDKESKNATSPVIFEDLRSKIQKRYKNFEAINDEAFIICDGGKTNIAKFELLLETDQYCIRVIAKGQSPRTFVKALSQAMYEIQEEKKTMNFGLSVPCMRCFWKSGALWNANAAGTEKIPIVGEFITCPESEYDSKMLKCKFCNTQYPVRELVSGVFSDDAKHKYPRYEDVPEKFDLEFKSDVFCFLKDMLITASPSIEARFVDYLMNCINTTHTDQKTSIKSRMLVDFLNSTTNSEDVSILIHEIKVHLIIIEEDFFFGYEHNLKKLVRTIMKTNAKVLVAFSNPKSVENCKQYGGELAAYLLQFPNIILNTKFSDCQNAADYDQIWSSVMNIAMFVIEKAEFLNTMVPNLLDKINSVKPHIINRYNRVDFAPEELKIKDHAVKEINPFDCIVCSEVARNNFGVVHNGKVAIGNESRMILSKELFAIPDKTERITRVFEREMIITSYASNEDSPHIIKLYGYVKALFQDTKYIALYQHIAGSNYRKVFMTEKQHREPNYGNYAMRLRMALDASAGLIVLKNKGIIHGNINPNNLLTNVQKRMIISDFGSSKLSDEKVEIKPVNPVYRAPEALTSQEYHDFASDIFQFGSILAEMFTFRCVFADKIIEIEEEAQQLSQDVLQVVLNKRYVMFTEKQTHQTFATHMDTHMKFPMSIDLRTLIVQCGHDESCCRPTIEILNAAIQNEYNQISVIDPVNLFE